MLRWQSQIFASRNNVKPSAFNYHLAAVDSKAVLGFDYFLSTPLDFFQFFGSHFSSLGTPNRGILSSFVAMPLRLDLARVNPLSYHIDEIHEVGPICSDNSHHFIPQREE